MKKVLLVLAVGLLSGLVFATDSLVIEPSGDVVVGENLRVEKDLTVNGNWVDYPLPPGFIYGLETVHTGINEVSIKWGKCRDYTDTDNLVLPDPGPGTDIALVKTLSTPTDNTTYHLFLFRKSSDGSIDAAFDTSIDGTNLPANSAFRRIASFTTDSTFKLLECFQHGDYFEYKTQVNESTPTISTNRVPATLTVPNSGDDYDIIAKFVVQLGSVTAGTTLAIVTNLNGTDISTSTATHLLSNPASEGQNMLDIPVNSQSQIGLRASQVNGIYRIVTLGYTDRRGQDGGK